VQAQTDEYDVKAQFTALLMIERLIEVTKYNWVHKKHDNKWNNTNNCVVSTFDDNSGDVGSLEHNSAQDQ